jgi:hypothetical protein
MLLVGLIGLLISIGGTIVSRTVIDELGASLETTLTLASDSLDAVDDTLHLTQTSVEQAGASLDTLAETAVNVSTTMNDTQPLLDKATETATQQIPDSIEAIQMALPDVAEAAGAIDSTLRVLNNFELDRRVFGIPIQFDLGIDYQPTASLDETVLTLGASLDGVPEDLRSLESDMLTTSANLALIGSNIETIADDLETISQTVDEIEPLLDQYIDIVAQTQELIAQAQADLGEQLDMLALAVTALFVWLGLNQIVPLYLGWTLLTGDDEDGEEAEPKQAQPATATAYGEDEMPDAPEAADEAEAEADES